jgi:hypothetical protein
LLAHEREDKGRSSWHDLAKHGRCCGRFARPCTRGAPLMERLFVSGDLTKKPSVAQGGKHTRAQRCDPLRRGEEGIDLAPTNGYVDEDLLRVFGTLASQGVGRLSPGRAPGHGLAEWPHARTHVVSDEPYRTRRQFSRCILGQDPVFWNACQYGDPVRDDPIGGRDMIACGAAFPWRRPTKPHKRESQSPIS